MRGTNLLPNDLSTCVGIDSSAPSLKRGIEFRINASRMSYGEVEDEFVSGIRG